VQGTDLGVPRVRDVGNLRDSEGVLDGARINCQSWMAFLLC
jgi:hypothetical protein